MESNKIKAFAKNYFQYISKLLNQLDLNQIAMLIEHIEEARRNQKAIFFIGNGGSAATSSHMANDFSINMYGKKEGELPLRALSLTDSSAVLSAIANDSGYDQVFVQQLRVQYRPGDQLIIISASGNSPNVVAAARWVKKNKGIVMSLVGFDGGELARISDVVIHVKTPKGEYGPVEDIHMIMNHLIITWLQSKNDKK